MTAKVSAVLAMSFLLLGTHSLTITVPRSLSSLISCVIGSYVWPDQVRFGLSPEEVGLLYNQLPQFGIELSRVPSSYVRPEEQFGEGISSTPNPDTPDKVLKVQPGEASTVSFHIDYVKDGIGGQMPGQGQEGQAGPLEVTVQAGEFEVITSIMKASMPYLVGWSTLMDLSMQRSVDDAMQGGGGASNPRYSGDGGGTGGTGVGGGGNVPF